MRAGAMYIPISYCIGLLALAHENSPVRGGLAEKLMAAPWTFGKPLRQCAKGPVQWLELQSASDRCYFQAPLSRNGS